MTQHSDGELGERAEAPGGSVMAPEQASAAGFGQAGQPSETPIRSLADMLEQCVGGARGRAWAFGLLLVVATVVAYQPVWRAGFTWDDDRHITENPMLVEPNGWAQIWFSRDAPQYYPLVWSSFRLERALWGFNSAGYHWVNILLHAASAVLVWRLLRRLGVPGAWLAGAIFALHPVNVESVAWISQRKNTLAMLFYLLSLGCYLRSEPAPRPSNGSQPSTLNYQPLWYWLSLAAFGLALTSKTAVAPLPLVLLGLAWWRRGTIERRDLWRSVPFFAMALLLGLITVWFERHQTAGGIVRDDSLWSRLVTAGWVVWFYLFKVLLPVHLMPVYPLWKIHAGKALSYLPGLLLVAGLLSCWRYRRTWCKAWLLCGGYFVVMLLPVLGFANIGFMRFSLVADHWQYFAMIGPVALVSAGLARGFGLPGQRTVSVVATGGGVLALGLGLLTWRQSAIYANTETFWRAALAANPSCMVAHSYLGLFLAAQGKFDEAIIHFQAGLALKPDEPALQDNLGLALFQQGKLDEAIPHLVAALEVKPDHPTLQRNLGLALLQRGRADEMIAYFKRRMRPDADNSVADSLIGKALVEQGKNEEAITYLQAALRDSARPGTGVWPAPRLADEAHKTLAPEVRNNLGVALLSQGKIEEAIGWYREALRLKPDYNDAHFNLGVALANQGKTNEALQQYAAALQTKPDPAELHLQLGLLLARAGKADEAIGHYRAALDAQPDLLEAHKSLGIALADKGEIREALTHYRAALRSAPDDLKMLDELAWALATYPDATVRNGAEAVRLAAHAAELAGTNNPSALDTLAAAYAESGNFIEATTAAQKALVLAEGAGQQDLAAKLRQRLQLYQSRKPFRTE